MNLPNRLTSARVVLTLVFVLLAAVPARPGSTAYLICWPVAYFIAVIAGVTDFFDGYLARRYNLVTEFGKLLDPLADKIHTIAGFVVLTENRIVPGWITIMIIIRELAVNSLRTIAANQGEVIPVSRIAKLKTAFQMFVLAFGGLIWIAWLPGWPWGGALSLYIWHGVLYALAIYTAFTGADYFYRGRHLYLRDM